VLESDRIADIQDQDVRAICAPRADFGRESLRGGSACGAWITRRAARRWRHQTAGGATRTRAVWRISRADRVPASDAIRIFVRLCEERRDNIDGDELATLRDIAKGWFQADVNRLTRAIADGLIQEVMNDDQEKA
jgi:hypothetical protein